jgi:hypothetical protein
MLMRFHWGLGVGHVYTHHQSCTSAAMVWHSESESNQGFRSRIVPDRPDELSEQTRMEEDVASGTGTDGSGSDSGDDDYEPSEEDDENSDDDDEELLDMDEMYDSIYSGDD